MLGHTSQGGVTVKLARAQAEGGQVRPHINSAISVDAGSLSATVAAEDLGALDLARFDSTTGGGGANPVKEGTPKAAAPKRTRQGTALSSSVRPCQ